jgi:hypothetical protein
VSRKGLIGSAGGVVLAMLVVVSVSELGRLSEYLGYQFPWSLATVPWLVGLGVVLGAAFRLGPRYPTLVGVAVGLLILTYTLRPPIGTLPTSFLQLRGYAPVSAFIIGALLAATVFALRGRPGSAGHGLSLRRSGLAVVIGFLLARISVYVLLPLLDLHNRSMFGPDWSAMPWLVLGLILFGGAFGVVVWAALRTRALGLGALAGLVTLIVTTPWLWTGGLRLLTSSHGIAAGSPVGLIMVGMLLVTVFPSRRASEQPPVKVPTESAT